jgi:hypothetical protein
VDEARRAVTSRVILADPDGVRIRLAAVAHVAVEGPDIRQRRRVLERKVEVEHIDRLWDMPPNVKLR